ncbi:MAG: alpha/beta hydrolase-fold protein [Planctomycetaceae bacterium]
MSHGTRNDEVADVTVVDLTETVTRRHQTGMFARASRLAVCLLTVSLMGAGVFLGTSQTFAGEVTLKSGFVIPGMPVPAPGIGPKSSATFNSLEVAPTSQYWMVVDGIRRYFVHKRNISPEQNGVNTGDDSSRYVKFALKHLSERRSTTPGSIGSFVDSTEFDEFGRRRVTLLTPRGQEHVHLGITGIHPRYLLIESTSHDWKFGWSPSRLSPERLREIIHTAIDTSNLDQRLAVVNYFLQSEIFTGARLELDSIAQDFPDQEERVADLKERLKNLYGDQALVEIRRRKQIGQHELAEFIARKLLMEDLSATTLRGAQELLDEYARDRGKVEQALLLLANHQAALPKDVAEKVGPLRTMLGQELTIDNVSRLEPFLLAEADETLTPSEKLALAYSGWVVGPSHAVTQLSEAIAYWDARFLVLDYLRLSNDRGDREELILKLQGLEGISVPVVSRMVPLMPCTIDAGMLPIGQPVEVIVPTQQPEETAVRYQVLLPPGYHPGRTYPAIMVMRAEGKSLEQTLSLWGGSNPFSGVGQRNGYIVITPDYADERQGTYLYDRNTQRVVLETLFDARRRFAIDSDRVFIAGNGMGGDAAIDIALSHPDLWAGAIPVSARIDKAAHVGVSNAPGLPFYFVNGERDRDLVSHNESDIAKMMRSGQDVLYCEYVDRGFESYSEELPRIFDWMSLQRRQRLQPEWKVDIVRETDNRVGWFEVTSLPASLSQPIVWDRYPREFTLSGRIITKNTANTISLSHGKGTVSVWLSPELVDFDQKVIVNLTGRGTKYSEIPQPRLKDMLDELRLRGDRQMLYWLKLVL